MFTLTRLAATLQTLFTTTAERAARESGFVRRKRVLTGPSFVQALVFGWMHKPAATLEELAQSAAACGTPVTPQSLDERFTPAAAECMLAVLRDALGRLSAARPQSPAVLRRFNGVHLFDSTTVALPDACAGRWKGCGGSGPESALKVAAHWELCGGQLRLQLRGGAGADRGAELRAADLPTGALRLADLGYFELHALAADTARGVYWVSRLQPQVLVAEGSEPPRAAGGYLAAQAAQRLECAVTLGAGGHRVGCRLLAWRVPPAEARRRQARAKEAAAKHGKRINADRLAMCEWLVLVTNAPADKLSAEEAAEVYRARWQVELLFKRWKSGGGLAAWRTANPDRIECEVYAKLVAALVRHWASLAGGGWWPGRSWWKCDRAVAGFADAIRRALRGVRALVRVLGELGQVLRRTCRLQARKKRPATYQRLAVPIEDGLT